MTFEYAPNMMIVKVHHLGSTMTYLLEESTASASLCYTGKLLLQQNLFGVVDIGAKSIVYG